ncbi:hypothetical protein [Frigoribacterium salinisoli]
MLHKKIASLGLAVALTAGALTGATTLTSAAPAEAASCRVSNLRTFSVDNVSCKRVRHVNEVRGGARKVAPWVPAGKTSKQRACWVNVTRYGFEYAV